MNLLAHLGLCTNQNDRFPNPFIYFEQQVKSLPFHIPKPLKRFPFQTELPRIGHYRKFSPPGNGGWSVVLAHVRVGYELAIIISYPTSASFIKDTHKVLKILPAFIWKNKQFSACCKFWADAYSYHIWGAWYNGFYFKKTKSLDNAILAFWLA